MKYPLMYIVAPATISFLMQSILCHKVKKSILRHATLIFPVIFIVRGVITFLSEQGGIFGGLGAVAAVLDFLVAFCAVFGYGVSWLVYVIMKKINGRERKK